MACRRSACRATMSRNRSACGRSSMAPSRRVSTKPLMLVIGVLSSCDTLATKSRRMFSSRRIWVMSFSTTSMPRSRPAAFRRAVAVPCRKRSASPRSTISPVVGSAFDMASVSRRCSPTLRITSCTVRPRACAAGTPRSASAAGFMAMTWACGSSASTPSCMLTRIASCSLRCCVTTLIWSSSCAAMLLSVAARLPISGVSGMRIWWEKSPAARCSALARMTCRERLIRAEEISPAPAASTVSVTTPTTRG